MEKPLDVLKDLKQQALLTETIVHSNHATLNIYSNIYCFIYEFLYLYFQGLDFHNSSEHTPHF